MRAAPAQESASFPARPGEVIVPRDRFDHLPDRVALTSAPGAEMLKPGDTAPPFDLPAAAGDRAGRLRLSQVDSEMVVLFFYPHDFSFICPTEVVGFHKAREAFAAEHTSIVAVSVDDVETHLRWARELGGIGYPLLADEDGALARLTACSTRAQARRCARPSSSIPNAPSSTASRAR